MSTQHLSPRMGSEERADAELARALVDEGNALADQGLHAEALSRYDAVLQRFEGAEELALRVQVARALHNKGNAWLLQARSGEALALFDEVIRRLDGEQEVEARRLLSIALLNKASALEALGRSEEAQATHHVLLRRLEGATEPVLQPLRARALIPHSLDLAQNGEPHRALSLLNEQLQRLGEASDALSRESLIHLYSTRAVVFTHWLDQPAEAVASCDEVLTRFEGATEAVARKLVTQAMFNKANALQRMAQPEPAITLYKEVVRRCDALGAEPVMAMLRATAQLAHIQLLQLLGRFAQSLVLHEELMRHAADAPRLNDVVISSLFCQSEALSALRRPQEALLACEEMLRRLDEGPEGEFTRPWRVVALQKKDQLRKLLS